MVQLSEWKAYLCSCWAATSESGVLIPTSSSSTIRIPSSTTSQLQLAWLYLINKSQSTHVSKVILHYSGSSKGDLNEYYVSFTLGLFLIAWVASRDLRVTERQIPTCDFRQGLTSATLELCVGIFIYLKIINACLVICTSEMEIRNWVGEERGFPLLSHHPVVTSFRGDGFRLVLSQLPLPRIWILIPCQPQC